VYVFKTKTMPEVSFKGQADRGVVGAFGKINYRTLGLYTYEYVDNYMLNLLVVHTVSAPESIE
jgi:hypothetical protein